MGSSHKRSATIREFGSVGLFGLLCRRASTLQKDNIPALLRITELHIKMGEVEPALVSLKACIHLDPEHAKCGKLFKRLRNLEKAIAHAEQAIANGRFRDALGENGLDVDKQSNKGASSLLEELKVEGSAQKKVAALICDCYVKLKRKEEALKRCNQAVKLDENNPDVLCNRADAYMLSDQFEEGAFGRWDRILECSRYM